MGPEGSTRPSRGATFGSLRVKLALATLVLLTLGAFCAAWYMRGLLTDPYERSVQAELQGLARSLAVDLNSADLHRPRELEERPERLRRAPPGLLSVSVFRRDGEGRMLVAAASAPGVGAKPPNREARRLALSGYGRPPLERRRRGAPLLNQAPSTEALTVPVRGALGAPIGEVRLRIDRTAVDAALVGDVRRMIVFAALVALVIGLSFAALLNRAVLSPLQQLREAIHALRAGSGETRLAWQRSDELGELSGDFDAMAAQLQESHSRLQSLAVKDPLTGLLNHRSFHEALQRELAEAEQSATPVAL